MPKEIHQLLHTFSYGDAISGEAIALQRVLQEAGCRSEIFAINEHPKLRGKSRHYSELPEDFSGEVVLHYSLGSPLNGLYRGLTKAKRWVVHHNITPSHYFSSINPRVANDIEQGVKEFPEILKMSDRILADSEFNRREVQALGFEAAVLGLPFDPHRWDLPRNQGIADIIQSEGGLHIVHVGRLAPNKRIDEVIKAFYFLHRHIEPRSRLWLVGIDIDTELYSFTLKRLAAILGIEERVHFVGCFADEELRALYETASAYLCMSEHEGFCLPLVEAMHFGLPVVACDSSAIPETVAGGGIICHTRDAAEVAEALFAVCSEGGLRKRTIAAGRARVKELSLDNFKANVTRLFGL